MEDHKKANFFVTSHRIVSNIIKLTVTYRQLESTLLYDSNVPVFSLFRISIDNYPR